MKPDRKPYASLKVFQEPNTTLMIQAPLPGFANTLPILLSIPGQGTANGSAAPLAHPGEIATTLDPDRAKHQL